MNYQIEFKKFIGILHTFFGNEVEGTVTQAINGVYLTPAEEEVYLEAKRLGLIIAGGAINSLFAGMHVNDLDFYMTDASREDEIVKFLSKYFNKTLPYKTENAYTFKRKSENSNKVWTVQLITRFVGTPKEIFNNFDFTVTQGAFDFTKDNFDLGECFLTDIARRRLVYCGNSMFPICAMYRTLKYQKRGYHLPGSTVMHIALSIVRLNIQNYKQLKQQLMGIDTQYLQNLLEKDRRFAENLPVDYGLFLEEAFSEINGFTSEDEEGAQ